jgi:pimeloyl-ACP methyl ester carboxylesterase
LIFTLQNLIHLHMKPTTPNLAYQQHGEGFPVVLLHGFCESKEIWKKVVLQLQTTCKIIVPDMPGFGESKNNTQYSSVEAMAEEIFQLLQQLEINQCIIVAHSLGGYVALALAEKYPEIMKGLALFHSTAYPDSEEKKHARNKTSDFIDKKGVAAFAENFVPPLFYKGRREELADEIQAVHRLVVQTPKETAVAVTKAMRDRPNRTHVLKEATYPVLFIAGAADEAVPLETSKEMFYLPRHSIVQLLAETAHMGMFERPLETIGMVKHFISLCLELLKKDTSV